MIFFRLIKNAFMTIMTVITFNFGWYKYNLIIKAAEFITSQSQYILFPLRFSPQKFSKWEKYRNFFLRKKAWQEECKLPFYKPYICTQSDSADVYSYFKITYMAATVCYLIHVLEWKHFSTSWTHRMANFKPHF